MTYLRPTVYSFKRSSFGRMCKTCDVFDRLNLLFNNYPWPSINSKYLLSFQVMGFVLAMTLAPAILYGMVRHAVRPTVPVSIIVLAKAIVFYQILVSVIPDMMVRRVTQQLSRTLTLQFLLLCCTMRPCWKTVPSERKFSKCKRAMPTQDEMDSFCSR